MTHKQKKPALRKKAAPDSELNRKEVRTEERPCSRKLQERPPDTRVEAIERR